MKNNVRPDPNTVHPIKGYDKEIYVKPTITNPNIIMGDFTYIAGSEHESHVTHHYDFIGDKLIIGKFCQIGAGVEFVINGANSVVGSDVAPYSVAVGNPAKELRKHFDDELIELMLKLKWWDKSIDEINGLIPILTCSDLEKVKLEILKNLI